MPMSSTARASRAARAAHATRTPEERKELARHAHLAGAVKAIVGRTRDLTDEQITALRSAIGGVSA